jgi:hypothetical protein
MKTKSIHNRLIRDEVQGTKKYPLRQGIFNVRFSSSRKYDVTCMNWNYLKYTV